MDANEIETMRRVSVERFDIMRQACESIHAWLETAEQHYTCSEFHGIENLFVAVYGRSANEVDDVRRWHAASDNEETDCSHAWYLLLQADYNAPEPVCTSDDPTNHQGDTCPVHEASS